MRKITVGICIAISLLALIISGLINEAYDDSEVVLPKYINIEKSDLEQLEKDKLIILANAGFLEARNMRDSLLRSNDYNSKMLIGISLLMLLQVAILSIYVVAVVEDVSHVKPTWCHCPS